MAKGTQKASLSPEEKEFCVEYHKNGGDTKAAYLHAFGISDDEYDRNYAANLLRRTAVIAMLEQLKRPGIEVAKNIYKRQMHIGNDKQQADAAKQFTQLFGDQENAGDVFKRWSDLMAEAGAQIVIPPHTDPMTLTFDSFRRGAAHIHLPLEAKLWLLHAAGAPWNDRDPKSRVSPLQTEALSREERELLILGATGVGKSALGGMFALLELLVPGKNIAVVAQFYKHVGNEFEYVVKGIKALFPDGLWESAFPVLKSINQHKYQDYHAISIWGSECKGYSASEQEGAMILGSGFDLVVCGEGDLIPYGVYNRKILRSIDRRAQNTGPGYRTGRVVMFTTPQYGEGAASSVYSRVMDETRGRPDLAQYPNAQWEISTWVRNAGFLENPGNDERIFEARKRTLGVEDPDAFAEQYEGKIRKRGSVVLREFDHDKHVIELPKPEELKQMRFGIGIDPGSKFGAVLIGKKKQHKYTVLGEVYNEYQRVKENVDAIKDMVAEILCPVVGAKWTGETQTDWKQVSHLIDAVVCDRASEQKFEIEDEFGDMGLQWCSFDLQGSLSSLRQLIAEGRFLVVDYCSYWLRDVSRYTYKTTKGLDVAVKTADVNKKYDHLIDATRYIIFGALEHSEFEEPVVQPTFEQAVHSHRMRQMHDDAWGIPSQQDLNDIFNY